MSISRFSGNKDTDREILLKLSDKDLLSACKSNKYLYTSVCDDNFFRRKLLLSYPNTLKYFNINEYKNCKRFYLKMIYYISKLKEEFNYLYIAGNPKKQYDIFKQSNSNQENLLYLASREGEIELVKEAISRGAHIRQGTGLSWASRYGYLEIVKYLVENGANIHALHDEAFRWAVENGHLEVVKYLVNQGVDIHIYDDEALKLASENGHLDVVKYLSGL